MTRNNEINPRRRVSVIPRREMAMTTREKRNG